MVQPRSQAQMQNRRLSLAQSNTPLFDPDTVNRELFSLLNVKSSTFIMGGHRHNYNHEEAIFFKNCATDQKKSIKKCPSCQYVFGSRDEMVYCSFCGLSNDQKCMQRTRYYPQSAVSENKLHSQRGPICKLCTYKFFIHERVIKSVAAINTAKITMKVHLDKLEAEGADNIDQKLLAEETNEMSQQKISEVEQENAHMAKEIKKIRQEAKEKKKENAKILNQREQLQKDSEKMQVDVNGTDTVYQELLLLSNELKVIKQNQVQSMAFEQEKKTTENKTTPKARCFSEASMDSQDLENIMTVPDDMADGEDKGLEFDDQDIFDQEQEQSGGGDINQYTESTTLEISRKGSDSVSEGGSFHRKRDPATNSSGSKGGPCGAGDDACCVIF